MTHTDSNWPFDDSDSVRRFDDLIQALSVAEDGGAAILGAGVSVSVGLPTWPDFHGKFLDHFKASVPTAGLNSTQAVLSAIDYIADRHHDEVLEFVKDELGRPVDAIPELLRLALTTRAFRYYYTTNLDETLVAAVGPHGVSVYPNFLPLNARYAYLHGRASTARSIDSDLVLGRRGYERGYDDSVGGYAKTQLRQLDRLPVVFIGFSMRDRHFATSLGEMAQAARIRQMFDSGVEVGEQIAELKWYSLEKAPDHRDPDRQEKKNRRRRYLNQVGVDVIWYRHGGSSDPYRAALEMVQQISHRTRELSVIDDDGSFVERLLAAEELASNESPSSSQVRQALLLLDGHPRIASAFWDTVDGIRWFECLRDANALGPLDSLVTANGQLRAPYWRAAGLLQRVAAIAPTSVGRYLLTIETDNWAAAREALAILQSLESSIGQEVGSHIASWLVRALPAEPMLLQRVSATSQLLDSNGKPEVALALLQSFLRRIAKSDLAIPENTELGLSQDVAPILGRSKSSLSALAESLQLSLERRCGTSDHDDVRFSRLAIEPHRFNERDTSIVSVLIDLLRDTLLACDIDDTRRDTVDDLLHSTWPTKRRIGIAHCVMRRSDLPVHESLIVTPENLSDQHSFHEMAKLISDDTSDLSVQSVQIIKDFVGGLFESEGEGDRIEYQLWSRLLPDHFLPEPPLPLESDDEDPDSILFRGLYYSEVFSPSAPMDSQGFSNLAEHLTAKELLDLVRDPSSAGIRVGVRHDPDEMWSLLADYATDREMLSLLLAIGREDLSNSQVWRVIEAMPTIAENDLQRWAAILDWTDAMISGSPPSQLWPLGRLLEDAAKSAPLDSSTRIRDLAMRIVIEARRKSVMESDFYEDSFLGGFLNHPAGKAMQTVLELLRREIFEVGSSEEGQQDIPEWFISDFLEPVNSDPEVFGIDAWIGIGRYYTLLLARAPDAVSFVPTYLELESSEHSLNTNAFWAGYLWAPAVSTDALERLRRAFSKIASSIQSDMSLEDELKRRFYMHIVIGTLRSVTGYSEMLLSSLSNDYSSETRGSIAFALGNCVRQTAGESNKALHEVAIRWFLRYWRQHVQRIGGEDAGQLAGYLRWLNDIDVPPRDIADLIEASLDQADGTFVISDVIDYLGRNASEDSDVVLQVLSRCVAWHRFAR